MIENNIFVAGPTAEFVENPYTENVNTRRSQSLLVDRRLRRGPLALEGPPLRGFDEWRTRPRPLLLTNGKSQEVGVHLRGGRRLSILRNPLFLDISRERHPSGGALPLGVDKEGEASGLIRQ